MNEEDPKPVSPSRVPQDEPSPSSEPPGGAIPAEAAPPTSSSSAGEPAEPAEPAEPGSHREFQPLDGRVISYWRVHSLISTGILLFLALVGGAILAFNVRDLIPVVIAVWIVFLLFRIFWLFWYPDRAYRAWGFRIDDKVLETRQGIWFRTITLLPLSRVQHVDLHRGPMERGFGLASLLLHTAGTMNATIEIPGLEAEMAARLRDHLVAVGGDDGV